LEVVHMVLRIATFIKMTVNTTKTCSKMTCSKTAFGTTVKICSAEFIHLAHYLEFHYKTCHSAKWLFT
jgi:hypothetical protein